MDTFFLTLLRVSAPKKRHQKTMSYKKIVSIFSLTMHNISHVYAEDASTQAPARLRRSLSEEIVTTTCGNSCLSQRGCMFRGKCYRCRLLEGKCKWTTWFTGGGSSFKRRITRQRLLRGSSFVEYQSMVAIEDIVAA